MGEAMERLRAQGFTFREADLDDAGDCEMTVAMQLELQQPGRERYGYGGMDDSLVAATRERLVPVLKQVRGRVFVAFNPDGVPVGIGVCQTQASTWKLGLVLNLQDFYVRADHRDRGIGTALLELMEETARNDGYVRFTLETQVKNFGARRLYRRRNYEGTDPEAEDAVLQMRLNF